MTDPDSDPGVELLTPDVPGGGGDPVALVELVNRVVDRGVVVSGEVLISVADVDLLYLGLRLLLASPDRLSTGGPSTDPESGARRESDDAVREAASTGDRG